MDAHVLSHMFGTTALWLLMVASLTPLLVGADKIDVQEAIANINKVTAETCIPGTNTTINMTFDHGQWNRYANVATKTANLLTKLIIKEEGKLSSMDEYFLFALARNNIRGDDVVYGSALAFEPEVFAKKSRFSIYAHVAGEKDTITFEFSQVSPEYDHTQPYAEWYAILHGQDWSRQRVTKDNVTYGTDDMVAHSQPQASVEDGHWTYPYFDCGAGNIWMVTYSAPIFGFNPSNNTPIFRGVVTIDIDLEHIDINQCDMDMSVGEQDASRIDMFRGTHVCQETTKCRPIKGLGFQSGAYICKCEDGFYFPNPPAKAFNGVDIERASNASSDANAYHCLSCSAGCATCEDDAPCQGQTSSSESSSLSSSGVLSSIIIMFSLSFILCVCRDDMAA